MGAAIVLPTHSYMLTKLPADKLYDIQVLKTAHCCFLRNLRGASSGGRGDPPPPTHTHTFGGSLKKSKASGSYFVSVRKRSNTSGKDIFIRGARGHCPPLNFDNPKRSKMLYVTCGTIIRRVVAAAKCKSSVIDFWIFFKYFLDVL